jgi:hypothetical protein
MTLTWDPSDVPAPGMALQEITADGTDLAGGVCVNMSATGEVTLGAGSTRYFRIVGRLEFVLDLKKGWNLVSVPIEPENPDPDVVFASADREERGSNNPGHSVIYTGNVWEWDPEAQDIDKDVMMIRALHGYWIHLTKAQQITVYGLPPATTVLRFVVGWNIVGPANAMDFPDLDELPGPAWWLKGKGLGNPQYDATLWLEPGLGYWILAEEPVDVDMGGRTGE